MPPLRILGISAYYHDSAACLLEDGVIVAAAHEERFSRRKHDPRFPRLAIRYCLDEAGATLDSIDAVVFYDKPFLKFERLLETWHAYAPAGLKAFTLAAPVWIKEKLFLKDLLRKELHSIEDCDPQKLNLLFSEHHLSHAASAFYPSPYQEAAVLTIDGVGEWSTASISHGKGSSLRMLRELRFPHSLGLLYSAFTYYLGFKVNSGEYKLMGLTPYADPGAGRIDEYERTILESMVELKEDGSIRLRQEFFNYSAGLTMTHDRAWEKLFGVPRRLPETALAPEHCDMAMAIQRVTEEAVLRMARLAKKLTGAEYLCMAGGVALNCVANGRLIREAPFAGIWIQPAAGDAGGALGSAMAVHHLKYQQPRSADDRTDAMRGSYLGPEYPDQEIERMARRHSAVYKKYDDFSELARDTAAEIDSARVVGWFQGRLEWGPRALGNRSILGDPRHPEMQKRLNVSIKYRESFRPFAPSVLWETTQEYFDIDVPSPYMLLCAPVQEARRHPLPDGYHAQPLREKLYFLRSDIPAITHLDYSARLQTVHRDTNPRYWELIDAFRERSGYGVVVNTSFNVRGEPIVCTPEDAYRCFMRTEMDTLVVGDYLFRKEDQQAWQEPHDWREEYELD